MTVAVDVVEVFAHSLVVVIVEAEMVAAAGAAEVGLPVVEAVKAALAAVEVVPSKGRGTTRCLGGTVDSENRIAG